MKKVSLLVILAGLCVSVFLSAPVKSDSGKKGIGAENGKLHKAANKIENSYIVVLDDAVVGEKGMFSIAPYVASELAATHEGQLKHVYQNALNGFAVQMSPEDAERLSLDFRVAYVEEDGVMTIDTTQTNPPWGLDRIDQRNRPTNGTYVFNHTGAGVFAYVID